MASRIVATSPSRTTRPPAWVTTSCSNSRGDSNRPRRRMVRSSKSPVSRPTGAARFCDCSAITTCPTPIPAACSASGRSSTVSSRSSAPTTFTCATPPMPRSSRVRPGSAMRLSSGASIRAEESARETIGRSLGSKRVRIGSSISRGRSPRIPEIASRMSCVACCRSLSKSKMTMIDAKLSSACELMSSTPEMLEIASSMGSTISRSTPSGEAPGYGIEMATTGGLTSGNSSVSSMKRAMTPNTTSATITVMVTTGFLMAKSEMNMS